MAQVVLRVLFPDRYILQGFFRPNETGKQPRVGVWSGGLSEPLLASFFPTTGLRLPGLWGSRVFWVVAVSVGQAVSLQSMSGGWAQGWGAQVLGAPMRPPVQGTGETEECPEDG